MTIGQADRERERTEQVYEKLKTTYGKRFEPAEPSKR